jgi:hypothetical protein
MYPLHVTITPSQHCCWVSSNRLLHFWEIEKINKYFLWLNLVSWLKPLNGSLSLWAPGLYPEPVRVGFVKEKVAAAKAFLLVLQFHFPCYHSTYDTRLFSSTCFSYQKDRRANHRIFVRIGLYETSPPLLYSYFINLIKIQMLPPSGTLFKLPSISLNSRSPFDGSERGVRGERERERDRTVCFFRHYPKFIILHYIPKYIFFK